MVESPLYPMALRSIIVKDVRLAAFAVGFTTSDTVIRKRYCATLAAVTLFSTFFVSHSASAGSLSAARPVPIAKDTDGVQAADLNRDGLTDLVTTIGGRDLTGILLARGDGTF